LPLTYTNITLDIVDIASDVTILNRDATLTERINIYQTGYYCISYAVSIQADAGTDTFYFRAYKNNTTVIPGSTRLTSEDDEINALEGICYAYLTAGDYVTFQCMASGGTNVLQIESTFVVERSSGVMGQIGPPGSGSTITVYNNGLNVSGSPFQILNFSGVSASSSGISNAVDITNIYGSHFSQTSSDVQSTTTSNTYQQKLRLTVSGLVNGTYRLAWYAETSSSSGGSDIRLRVQQNDVTDLAITNIELQDATTYLPQSGFVYVSLSSATTYNFDLDYSSEISSVTTYIRRARLEFWRVS